MKFSERTWCFQTIYFLDYEKGEREHFYHLWITNSEEKYELLVKFEKWSKNEILRKDLVFSNNLLSRLWKRWKRALLSFMNNEQWRKIWTTGEINYHNYIKDSSNLGEYLHSSSLK